MRFHPFCVALVLAVSASLVATPALAAGDDIGLKVLVQPWDPITDNDTPITVLDDPTLISSLVTRLYTEAHETLHDPLVQWLGTGNLLFDGITLYDIDLVVNEPTVSIAWVDGGGADTLSMLATVRFDDLHFEATSTTPSTEVLDVEVGAGSYADPRCSIDLDLTMEAPIGIGWDPANPLFTDLTVDQAATRPVGRISDFRVDSQNLPCDILVEVMTMFNVDDYLTDILTDPTSELAVDVNEDLIEAWVDTIGSANAEVASVVPAGLVRMNAWAYPGQPITLAFGPAGPFPDVDDRATLTGTFRSLSGDSPALTQAVECAYLPVHVNRKTGPRPILEPDGTLGTAPFEPLDAAMSCEIGPDGVETYMLTGLSPVFPNEVILSSDTGCDTSDPSSIQSVVRIEGMPEYLLAADLYQTYDLLGEAWSGSCGGQTNELQDFEDQYVDPVINPADTTFVPGDTLAGTTVEDVTNTLPSVSQGTLPGSQVIIRGAGTSVGR